MSDNHKYLVSLETSGNQAYVFATNKRRDILGASQCIRQAGFDFVFEALGYSRDLIKRGEPIIDNRIILQTSGKAMLVFDTQDAAKEFVTAWSRLVLVETPGLDATAVVVDKPFNLLANCTDSDNGIVAAIEKAHKKFEEARCLRPSPLARFQRLPIVAPCQVSSLGASTWSKEGPKDILISHPVAAKRNAVNAAQNYLNSDLHKTLGGVPFKDVSKLDNCEWLAVIHADGNGLGQLFINFHDYIDGNSAEYAQTYGDFSKELDSISKQAYRQTVRTVFDVKDNPTESPKQLPILPIVVAGDDLTVVIDGKQAIFFAETFIKEFCQLTTKSSIITAICETPKAKRILGEARLGMAAGICICKPHFPFSTAYKLAEDLCQSAKKAKEKANFASASLDFHILYDSTALDLKSIREKLIIRNAVLTAKPFLVESVGDPKHSSWCNEHDWQKFKQAAEALQKKDEKRDKKPCLPSSQAYTVRENLFEQTIEKQEDRWEFLCTQYPDFGECWPGGKLYHELTSDTSTVYKEQPSYTLFLDALEAKEFYKADNAIETQREVQ